MKAYKEDQGRLARMFAFWALAFMIFFGCTWLHGMLVGFESMRAALGGIRIPIVAVDVNIAFLISGALFLVAILWLLSWSKKPKVADLLIETEAELRKVTWPTAQEVVNSSVVVIIFVVLMLGYLAGVDALLMRLIDVIIYGGA